MSHKKTVMRRRSWTAIKRARAATPDRRAACSQAKDAFELAEQIRHARESLGLSQAEFAARIGSTQPAVARLEAGGVTPSLRTLRRVAAALGLDLIVELRARVAA